MSQKFKEGASECTFHLPPHVSTPTLPPSLHFPIPTGGNVQPNRQRFSSFAHQKHLVSLLHHPPPRSFPSFDRGEVARPEDGAAVGGKEGDEPGGRCAEEEEDLGQPKVRVSDRGRRRGGREHDALGRWGR